MKPARASRHRKARAVTIVALVAFFLVDAALAVVAWRFLQRRAAAGSASASRAAAWSQSLLPSGPDGAALLMALVQQQARLERQLNLSVSVQGGIMHLQREGAPLRRMRVVPGPEVTVGEGVRIGRPRGRRRLLRIVGEEFVWSVPRWVFAHRGLQPPPAAAREVRGGLGSLALILDDGTLIYSRPAHGPLSTDGYVMPGALRAELSDLEAIRASLHPGMPVYIH